MNQVAQEVLKLLGMVVIAMVLYLVMQATIRASQYLKVRLQKKQNEAEAAGKTAQAAAFSFAVNILNSVTSTVVSSIEARKAYYIRQAVHAGQAKAEELNVLSTEAYEEIVKLLDEEARSILDACLDDSEQFIRDKIEELLPKVKADYLKTLPQKQDNAAMGDTADAEPTED